MPDVQIMAVGRWLFLAIPRAKNAPDLSSKTGMLSMFGWLAKAMARGVEPQAAQHISYTHHKLPTN